MQKCNITKRVHGWNMILLVCAVVCLICYDIFGGLWLKGLTSSWFVLLGLLNVCYAYKMQVKDKKTILMLMLGLILGMCADILLGIDLILGILFFASGHVLYLIAFFTIEKPEKRDLMCVVPIVMMSMFIVVGLPYIQIEDPILEKLLLGYAAIIGTMLGKAIANWRKYKDVYRTLILVGSIMFWCSDVALAVDMFGAGGRLSWILCSYNYWPAQSILAHSIFYYVNSELQIG